MTDDDLRSQIEEYLRALGCEPVERPDPHSHWHLTFEYPKGTGNLMLVASPEGPAPSVVVASVVRLAENHVRAYGELPDADKQHFLFGLRRALNRGESDFRLNEMEKPLDCPRSFQVSARHFPDGLSLDQFARTVGNVFKTQLEGIWYIQERLEDRSGDVTVFFDLSGEDMPRA